MVKLLTAVSVLVLGGCAMQPEHIQGEIDECNAQADLVPVVVVGNQLAVKRVFCTVDSGTGYTLIERDLKLLELKRKLP